MYTSDGIVLLGEVMGIDGNKKVYIAQRKDTNRNSKIDVKKYADIIALLSSTKFA